MKTLLVFLCVLSVVGAGFAQAPAAQETAPQFNSQELDQLLGPIALYPDPLIALILPASTVPSDIAAADRFMIQGGDPAEIPSQPWDDSVKGLTHYPDLLKWLDQNIGWTTQLGTAYLAQPADVMDAIQQLRAQAKADGTLVNTDQQQVGVDDGNLTIEPTNPDTVYVPQYDPDAVYNDDYNPDDGSLLTFDDGYPVGPWLYYWPDWHHRGIFLGDWHRWRDHRGRPGYAGDLNDNGARQWHPNQDRVRTQFQVKGPSVAHTALVRPQPLPGVTIVHPKHEVAHPGVLSAPQRDFTGRGPVVARPAIVARPVVVQPTGQPPAQSVISGYGRGSDARAASERGQFSRQTFVPRPVAPVAPAAPVYARPVQPIIRPVAPVAPMAPVAPAFQGMSSGAGAGSAGARGAQSRFGR